MNRFSAREFALLCLPVAAIAGAGLWVATRPAPIPLHLDFRVEKPTTLEAFGGADAVWVTKIEGDDANNPEIEFAKMERTVELKTRGGTQIVPTNQWSNLSPWRNVWKGSQSFNRLPLAQMSIPAGELSFKYQTQPVHKNFKKSHASATPLPPLVGSWKIDRSRFAPFNFNALARTPQIKIRAIKVIAGGPGLVQSEIQFDLLGAGMDAQTPIDFNLLGTLNFKGTTYLPSYETNATVDPKNPLRRTVKWTLNGPASPPPKTMGDVHGRVSANERWPLTFQLDPIDISKVKAGRNLKFRQWPAPIPK